MVSIEYYKNDNKREPAKEFIDSLEDKAALKIFWVMKLIQQADNIMLVPSEYFKKLSNDIWEIRAKLGNNAFRLLCFFDGGKLIIATNGFRKKTQKTPQKEIETASERKILYFKRKELKNGQS